MKNTDKTGCVLLADILHHHGVKKAVLCPGTRDLPLIMAFNRHDGISCLSVIDERAAAFVALGISEITRDPVALVCTSGTAVLDFSPAVAEAYYKNIPLIVISADRASMWIDQEDSQTTRQFKILDNFVKKSYDLKAEIEDPNEAWFFSRNANEAAIKATEGPMGPVHINIHISMPVNGEENRDILPQPFFVENFTIEKTFSREKGKELACKILNTPRVIIACGSMQPDARMNRDLNRISSLENVLVISEGLSNLHLKECVSSIDTFLAYLGREGREQLFPDLLITFGGPFVSQFLKDWLRNAPKSMTHWHISENSDVVDTFQHLSCKFNMTPSAFFSDLLKYMRKKDTPIGWDYKRSFLDKQSMQFGKQRKYLDETGWSDLTALNAVADKLPDNVNLQVSNGMAVRYLLALPQNQKFHRLDCNRGVSGIDGCISTSIGASTAYKGITVMITGDMSAQYDMASFSIAKELTRNFKLVVLANGGGNIFKFIKSTRDSAETEKFLYHPMICELGELAKSQGWKVFEATNFEELDSAVSKWIAKREEPSMLILKTDAETNGTVFSEYLSLK